MSDRTYKVATAEGAAFASAWVGQNIEVDASIVLDLDDVELAVVAAGWLEPTATDKKTERGRG